MRKNLFPVAVLLCLMVFPIAGKEIMGQKSLRHTWVKNDPDLTVEFKEEFAHAESKKSVRKALAVQTTYDNSIKGGARYQIFFQARGNVSISLRPMFDGKSSKLLLENSKLTPAWKDVELTFTAPQKAKKFACGIYSWSQKGYFDIRGFSVRELTDGE